MTDLTPRAGATTTAQSFTVMTVVDYMRGLAVLQALPPYIHTGVKLFSLFNPAFDDVLFAVVTFHVCYCNKSRGRRFNASPPAKLPCCATPRPAAPCHAEPRHAAPRRVCVVRLLKNLALPSRAVPRHAQPSRAAPRPAPRCLVWVCGKNKPCLARPRPAAPRHAEPCPAMPCLARPRRVVYYARTSNWSTRYRPNV